MSELESSNESSNNEVEVITMFRCRLCPGKEFTAPERDLHKQEHRRQGQLNRASAIQDGRSELTLFDRVPSDESNSKRHRGGGKKRPANSDVSETSSAKQRRIRSTKKYDKHIEKASSSGG